MRASWGTDDLVTTEAETIGNNFIPNNTEWIERSVNIQAAAEQENVIIRFEFSGDRGGYLYIDNVRLMGEWIGINEDLNTNEIYVNPTGQFIIGGPDGDTGLTGRKIIVDTYGGAAPHGGGAFSGKDPSKVDRSAAYATRHIAKNLVAAGVAERILVQVSYAIGVAEPMGIFVDTYGSAKINMTDGEIANKIQNMPCFNLKPASIISRLKLKTPIYSETAAYGHMGRNPEKVTKTFVSPDGAEKTIEVELFPWEKLDYVDKIKSNFQF